MSLQLHVTSRLTLVVLGRGFTLPPPYHTTLQQNIHMGLHWVTIYVLLTGTELSHSLEFRYVFKQSVA